MTTASALDGLDVRTLPPDQIPDVRARLVDEARSLVADSTGDELAPGDAERFERIEQVIGTLDVRARGEALAAQVAGTPIGAAIAGLDATGDGYEVRHRIAPVRFPADALRAAHDALQTRQAGAIEQRNAVEVPMALVPGQRLDPVPFMRETTRIASLIPAEEVPSPKVTFYQQTTAASAAAPVAEGGEKPTSDPVWEDTTETVTKIAHMTNVSTEALADYSNFRQVVEGEMIRGLINVENTQLLTGDGVALNMTGLLSTTGILTYAPGSAEARFKSLLHGITLLRKGTAFIEPDTMVLHPDDYELLMLTAATTGELIITQDPTMPGVERIWGVRIVVSSQITTGVALLVNFAEATRLFVRQAPTILVDPYTLSANNMVRFIAEERIALGVGLPAAICKVTFNGTT